MKGFNGRTILANVLIRSEVLAGAFGGEAPKSWKKILDNWASPFQPFDYGYEEKGLSEAVRYKLHTSLEDYSGYFVLGQISIL